LQEGAFPFPVKYGYCAVGRVEAGPAELLGRMVFCLHPHQEVFLAPVDMLRPVPAGVPPRRATLAANMETALNALWDSGAGPGDRIVVVGAGVLGLLVTALAAKLPGAEVVTQ
jgi:threonine dehydrogenase-like Zn-dependent dehydrogenase